MKAESNKALPFLDVLSIRRSDESLQCSIFRKLTWMGQYINFSSFYLLVNKRTLISHLVYRARKDMHMIPVKMNCRFTYHPDKNRYPDKFIQIIVKHQPWTKPSITVDKKNLFFELLFKVHQIYPYC